MNEGIVTVDVHGMNTFGAKTLIDSKLKGSKAYRIIVVHGYHGGTALRDMVRSTYKNHPKVLRVEVGLNLGETTLVLKELF